MMTVAGLVALAAMGLFVILQQALSRVIFLEVALSQGVSAEPASTTNPTSSLPDGFRPTDAARELPPDAIVVLASATCTSCIRLVDDLGADDVSSDLPLHVYFDQDAPRVAQQLGAKAVVHERARTVIDRLGTPALPYGVVMVSGEVAAHGPLPDLRRLVTLTTQADVGFRAAFTGDGNSSDDVR